MPGCDFEEKAIQLNLRQSEGSLVVFGILGGDHKEICAKGEALTLDRHLPLFHGLKQSRLRSRWGAIDFVGNHDVSENRPFDEVELLLSRRVHVRSQDIRRQHVARELNARK